MFNSVDGSGENDDISNVGDNDGSLLESQHFLLFLLLLLLLSLQLLLSLLLLLLLLLLSSSLILLLLLHNLKSGENGAEVDFGIDIGRNVLSGDNEEDSLLVGGGDSLKNIGSSKTDRKSVV